MQLSRNDLCPCNSGKKYKKCCQEPVEEFTGRLVQAIGTVVYKPAGLEIAHALGLWCGLQLPDASAPPDPGLLGRLLTEAWAVNEQDAVLSNRIKNLLLDKQHLHRLRIPVNLLTGVNLQADAAGRADLLERITGSLPSGFFDYAVYQMALSLRNDQYSDEELTTLLIGFSWALLDQETRQALVAHVLDATLTELATAQQELAKLELNNQDAAGPEMNEQMRQFFAGHPSYDGFVSAQILADIQPAFREITAAGTLEMPFYAVAGGCYALFYEVLGKMSEKQQLQGLPGGQALQALRSMLWGQDEYLCFIPLLRQAITRWPETDQPESLVKSVHDLGNLLSGFFMSAQFSLVENFYLYCIVGLIRNVSRSLPGTDIPVNGFLDLCSPDAIEPYISYLEQQNLQEEAGHVRQQFQSWAYRITRKYASLAEALPAGLQVQDLLETVLT